MTGKTPCGICVTGATGIFPCEIELFSKDTGGTTEIWDGTTSELNGTDTLGLLSPIPDGDDQILKSGKDDGGCTFDNKFPAWGFTKLVADFGTPETILALDSER